MAEPLSPFTYVLPEDEQHAADVRREIDRKEEKEKNAPAFSSFMDSWLQHAEGMSGGERLNPVKNREDLVDRGYATRDDAGNYADTEWGQATSRLIEWGLVDPGTMTPTEKGWSYAYPEDKLLEEGNFTLWRAGWDRGRFRKDGRTVGETIRETGSYLKDTAAGLSRAWARVNTVPLSPLLPDEWKAKADTTLRNIPAGSLKQSASLGAGVAAWEEKLIGKILGDDEMMARAVFDHRKAQQNMEEFLTDDAVAALVGGDALSDAAVKQGIKDSVALQKAAVDRGDSPEEGREEFQEGVRQGQAAGLVADPAVLVPGAIAGKVARMSQAPGILGLAGRRMTRWLAASERHAAMTVENVAAMRRVQLLEDGVTRAAAQAGSKGGKYAEATKALEARLVEARAAQKAIETEARMVGETARKLTPTGKGAQALEATAKKIRATKAAGPKGTAAAADWVGDKILAANEKIAEWMTKAGMDPVTAKATLGAMRGVGITGLGVGGAAVAGPVGALSSLLASGHAWKQLANFSRVVGLETAKHKAGMPFWARVAANEEASALTRGLAHTFDVPARAGNFLGRTGKGVAAAAPADVAFEAVAAGPGENPANVVKQGIAESMTFGAVPATLGAVMPMTKADLGRAAVGAEINFREGLLTNEERQLFGQLKPGPRRMISIYSETFPNLDFIFKNDGDSFYDPATNRIHLNVNSKNLLTPLIAHEVNHFIHDQGGMVNGIEGMLLGVPGTPTGGLLRNSDGTLDPNFQAFVDAYNSRMEARGMPPRNLSDMALEYFTEATVDELLQLTFSGDLQRAARRSKLGRVVSEMFEGVPILKDMMFKLGGAKNEAGKPVSGSGLLAEGLKNMPEAKRMLREAVKHDAGFRKTAAGKDRKNGKISEKVPPAEYLADKALLDGMHSAWKTDEAGNVQYHPDGKPIKLTRAELAERAAIGARLAEFLDKAEQAGTIFPEEHVRRKENGQTEGTYFNDAFIDQLAELGTLNKKQVATLRGLNRAARSADGSVFMMLYQPAIHTGAKGNKKYRPLPLTFRKEVPIAFEITNAGNLVVKTLSVTKLTDNIKKRAATSAGRDLYDGDVVAITRDVDDYLAAHKAGRDTIDLFAEKYGPQKARKYRDFVNSLFGLMRKDQREKNPVFDEMKLPERDVVVRSRRIDRINQNSKIADGRKMPFDYLKAVQNLLPEPVE